MWLTNFLPQKFERPRIITFDYSLSCESGITVSSIREIALTLLHQLEERRQDENVGVFCLALSSPKPIFHVQAKNRRLVFLAHDIGGVIIKQVSKLPHEANDRDPKDSLNPGPF